MKGKVVFCESFKALREYHNRGPLSKEELHRMQLLIPNCPLKGQPFDEDNMLYPLLIPKTLCAFRLSETENIYSISLRYDQRVFVGVVGGEDMKLACESYKGEFLFAVGRLQEKEKNGRVFLNLRPRGWFVVVAGKKPKKATG